MYETEMLQLEQLRRQADAGDPLAETELRRRLAPHLDLIVRRALNPDSKPTELTCRIRNVRRHLQARGLAGQAEGRDGVVRQVTRWLVSRMTGASRRFLPASGPTMQETVRC